MEEVAEQFLHERIMFASFPERSRQLLGSLLTRRGLLESVPFAIVCTDGNLHEFKTIVIGYTDWRYRPQYSKSYASTLKQALPQVSTSCSRYTLNTCILTVQCLICALQYAINHLTGCVNSRHVT